MSLVEFVLAFEGPSTPALTWLRVVTALWGLTVIGYSAMLGAMVVATVRSEIADFLNALLTVYVILIIAYIVVNLLLSFGLRPGYYRWLDAVLGFLRDVSEPYLGLFRRFIPPIGPLDISPIVALLELQLVGGLLINAIDDTR